VNAVHPPLTICLWLFEDGPEVDEIEDDGEICDDCTSANGDDENVGRSGEY